MKQTFARFLAFLLALGLLFALTACEQKKSGSKRPSKDKSSYEEEDEDDTTEDKKEETEPDEENPDITLDVSIPELDMETAQTIISWYNTYSNFGVCASSAIDVSSAEAKNILLSAGYDEEYLDLYAMQEVSCCGSLEESREHVGEYLADSLIDSVYGWQCNPIERNGKLYSVAAAMGYGGYYITGELVQETETLTSTTVRFDYEEEDCIALFQYEDSHWKLLGFQQPVSEAGLSQDQAWTLLNKANLLMHGLKYYMEDCGRIDYENRYNGPAIGTVGDCVSVSDISNISDVFSLLSSEFTLRFLEERLNEMYWYRDEICMMESYWFEDGNRVYLMDGESHPLLLLEDTLHYWESEPGIYVVSAEQATYTGSVYCRLMAQEDGSYKVLDCHIGSGTPDSATARMLLRRYERANYYLLYHFAIDNQVRWDDTFAINVMPEDFDVQMVDTYALDGIYGWEEIENSLAPYYSESKTAQYGQESYTLGEIPIYKGDWFLHDGTAYAIPNWGMGVPMTYYDTIQVQEIGENRWQITADAEFDTSVECVVVWEDGTYKVDQ